MFTWSDTFKSERTNYFTAYSLRLFANYHKKNYLKASMNRDELIRGIELFANESGENEVIVKEWIDLTMREGKRDIVIQKFDNNPFTDEFLNSDEKIKSILESYIINKDNRHFVGNSYNEDYQLVKYKISSEEQGKVISLYLCKFIYCSDDRKNNLISSQIYPIVVDVLVDKGCIISRVKTKSNMFKYRDDTADIRNLERTNSESEGFKGIQYCKKILQLNNAEGNYDCFKHALYRLVDSCTFTPEEIQSIMDDNKEKMDSIMENIMNNICILDEKYKKDVEWDVRNMIEKYFSITYPDQSIFTKGRPAYPIRLDATDEQYSKVQQIAGLEQPLQSKDIFFDNKKMLQKNKKCDSVKMSYERKSSLYCDDRFSVQITVKPKGCIIKYFDYTLEEDMQNVLLTIIGNEEVG